MEQEYTKYEVKPYYKYKQEAYNKIRSVAIGLLRESDFFVRTGLSEDVDVIFGNNTVVGVQGCIGFYIQDQQVLEIFGTKVSGPKIYNIRGQLTQREHDIICDNLRLIFKHSSKLTIPAYLGVPIHEWAATKDFCTFAHGGYVYLNQNP